MADDAELTLKFECGGATVELSGDRKFVERMYRRLMDDIEEARRRVRDRAGEVEIPTPEKKKRPTAWVSRCGEMMRKVYMFSESELESTPLEGIVDLEELSTVHVSREVFSRFFCDHENKKTLWSKFAPEAREKLAELSEPSVT